MSKVMVQVSQSTRRQPLRTLALSALVLLVAFGVFFATINLWAWYNFNATKDALEIGDYQQAEKHLERCLTFWSGNGQVHFWMARVARSLGKYDKAQEHLDKCEELHWSPEGIQLESTLLKAQQGEFREVEYLLIELADKDNEETVAVLEVLADNYARNAQVAQALYWGERFLKHYPNNANALFGLAQIYELTHNATDALKYYRKAVATLPDNEQWRLALARALLVFNEPQAALVQFKELCSRRIESEPVLLGLAKCHRTLGGKRKAQELLDKLCADYPESWEVWAERGKLALQQGERELAEKCFRKAVAANPYENTTLYSLYLCLRQKGKAKRAEADQLHARYLRLTKDSTRLHILITQEMSKEPDNPAVTFEIARVLKRLGQEKAAENWLQKTIQLRPYHRGARKALAAYYEKIGNKGLAARFK